MVCLLKPCCHAYRSVADANAAYLLKRDMNEMMMVVSAGMMWPSRLMSTGLLRTVPIATVGIMRMDSCKAWDGKRQESHLHRD